VDLAEKEEIVEGLAEKEEMALGLLKQHWGYLGHPLCNPQVSFLQVAALSAEFR
jgi:hypothetical protein